MDTVAVKRGLGSTLLEGEEEGVSHMRFTRHDGNSLDGTCCHSFLG